MGALSAISNVFGSLIGAHSQNRAINKQIKAQREENEKTRQYNKELAVQQNQWNVDQWNREVQYNDPAAQMARFKAAGLNPNLIYGQTNTAPQLSGSLTSGAPATPTDMSALGNKKSPVASVFNAIKENPFLFEDLRSRRLDNDLKAEDLKRSRLDSEVASKFFGFGSTDWNSLMENDSDYRSLTDSLPAPVRQKFDEMRHQYFASKEVQERWKERVIANAIGQSTYQSVIKKIMAEANITYDNARYIFDTYTERVAGCKAQNMMLQTEADWMTTEKYVQIGASAANILLNGYTAVYGRKFGISN